MAESSCDSVKLLLVGQLAEKAKKTVRAVRFYEELGLLKPVQRTKGGFRQYDESALIRIHWIDRLQELGFSLNEIRDFLASLQQEKYGPVAMEQLQRFYAKKVEETRQKVSRLQGLEKELTQSLFFLSGCQECADETLQSACRSCEDFAQDGPPLVAAIHPMNRKPESNLGVE